MKTRLPLVLLFLAVLAGYYLLGSGYLKQRQYGEHLQEQIAGASRTLAAMPQPAPDTEQRLALAQANLTAAENNFPGLVNSTLVINAILKLADDVGVTAIPLATQPWSAEKTGVHDYYVLRLNVFVAGDFSRLVKFMDGLEKGEFPTLIIEQASLTGGAEPAPAGADSGAALSVSASLDLAVYARSPPAE